MLAALFSLMLFLVLVLYWAIEIRPFYYPSGDEYALIVASTMRFHPSPASWFLDGFRHYFLSYPGLAAGSTDFIRPMANATYYLNSIVFRSRWAYYLLANYAIQACLAGLSMKLASELTTLRMRLVLLVGLLVALSPAFGGQQIFFPSFAFDLLGALLVLQALFQLWRGRFQIAWLLFLAAVFTKETTLFAPLVTACLVWRAEKSAAVSRRLALSLIWLGPCLIWALVRHLAFHGSGSVYVLLGAKLTSLASGVLHAFLAWPFGTRTVNQGPVFRYLFFPLNGAFWLICGVVAMRERWRARTTDKATRGVTEKISTDTSFYLTCYCTGSLVLPLLLNQSLRFGACFFPLLYVLLVRASVRSYTGLARRWASTCLLALGIMAIYQKMIEPVDLNYAKPRWQLARSYIETIHATRASTLVLVDDATGGLTTPDIIARFADFRGTLVRANNIENVTFSQCKAQPKLGVTSFGDDLLLVSSMDPLCSFYALDGVEPKFVSSAGPTLGWNVNNQLHITYQLPPFSPDPRSAVPEMFDTLGIRLASRSGRLSVLVPHLQELRYREIP